MKDEKGNVSISHVAVKAPPFYMKSPVTWFRQIESQFHLAKITNTETMFHQVLAALPEEVAECIPYDAASNYEELKSIICDNLKRNRHELIDEALSSVELNGKRPTQLVVEIQRTFKEIDLNPDESIIKSRLLSALPPNIRAALVGHDTASLSDYAIITDNMLALASPPINPFAIREIQQK